MIDHQLVNQLADLCGMSGQYLDWAGKPVTINVDYKIPLLEAMGFDMSSSESVIKAITGHRAKQWHRALPDVRVVHRGKTLTVSVRLAASTLEKNIELNLLTEDGRQQTISAEPKEQTVLDITTLDGNEYVCLDVTLPENLPLGYHQLTLASDDNNCLLIVAPETCFEPELLENSGKIWGSSIQLYSVRSKENWGMGDYRDLETITRELGNSGASMVGLNPVHALYSGNPQHCSPYSPSSRIFGNVLYINPEIVPEFAGCEPAKELFNNDEFQQHLNKVRNEDYVDYQTSGWLKLSVLEKLFEDFAANHLAKNTTRAKGFIAFCEDRGSSLRQFATFEALYEHFRKQDLMNWGWPCWPETFQKPDTAEVKAFAKENEQRIQYFQYLQWLAEEQITVAQKAAKDAGMTVGVYRDLAVGVDRGGADVWGDHNLFVLGASTGAPPDGLGPQGQNWGLPPFNPVVLQERRYKPFIEMIRNSMRNCGALRIDHAMGLFRLWWCPNGKGAAEGAYVHYPLQDLLGIIKLESRRQQCLVFGEDLGTVPQEITDSLPPARFYSSIMGIFGQDGDRYLPAHEFKPKALATLVCHDTPTIRGWWEEKDIELCHELGIYDDDAVSHERWARENSRKAVINTLADMGELPSGTDPYAAKAPAYSRELMERFSYYLALSNSQIAGIQLEDCMMIDTPVNMPGTSEEYPNWRRRLTENLDEFFASEANKTFFSNLTNCRKS
ncbi:4-alpha-glucanotransferase [Endozoicomonas sp. OPT23]|uniref:4-alpha-glucanotransferase n=1 Tax=Endozoicomonas sp. OPT23 TaxID=2072845 RepID=UPI00129BA99C|nr:4-alpha-glucanotransferase [Endozoicomonas sp. OPT23]MRI32333.1 4-alpha-glucanotransferase [Endozoicomonas sp. OPT23]